MAQARPSSPPFGYAVAKAVTTGLRPIPRRWGKTSQTEAPGTDESHPGSLVARPWWVQSGPSPAPAAYANALPARRLRGVE